MTPEGAPRARVMPGAWRIPFYCFIFACLPALLAGCRKHDSAGTPPPPPQKELWKEFSGDNAFACVKALVDFGPRPSGSRELTMTRDYLVETLKQAGWQVDSQKFNDETPGGRIAFTNLIARFPVSADKPAATDTQRAIIASHYDTKLFNTIHYDGANGGASGAGALLELARVLALDPVLAQKIELVFFDGGEPVQQSSAKDGLYGSRYFARQLRESGRAGQFKFAIVWDMIGRKNTTITLPPDSPPELAKGILDASVALNQRDHFTSLDREVPGDHQPLDACGIPAIDLVDFGDTYWHTADDTLDKLSPGSLQMTGSVTLYYLQARLASQP